MISKTMQDAINTQINEELYSSYLYLSMVAWFEHSNLPGMAHWMQVQSGEETAHAMKLFKHLVDRAGRVELKALPQPAGEWKNPLDAFQKALEHERHITKCIHALAQQAAGEKDLAAGVMLQWFVSEQVEEESSAEQIVEALKRVGDNVGGLMILDHGLGERK